MKSLSSYGQQIRSFVVEPETGAILCPHCDLEMSTAELHAIYYCGSGQHGDGHWLSVQDVDAGAH